MFIRCIRAEVTVHAMQSKKLVLYYTKASKTTSELNPTSTMFNIKFNTEVL